MLSAGVAIELVYNRGYTPELYPEGVGVTGVYPRFEYKEGLKSFYHSFLVLSLISGFTIYGNTTL
jgi:hypothetical protein